MNIARLVLPACLALVALTTLTALGPAPAPASQPNSCSRAHRAEVEAFAALYFEIFNDQDLARLDEIMTPDAINHNPFGTMTVEELAATMAEFFIAFPDLHYELESLTIDGDQVVFEYTYTGTHLGPLMGLAPTGVAVHGRGLELHTLADGRITASRNYADALGMFTQLGLL
jgi:steroid delta-isomerase-like uncharacterized protein